MILVTGATGFLGTEIARQLAERRTPFRALARDPSRLTFEPKEWGCRVVFGDIADHETLIRAMRGMAYVIHTAGLVKQWVPQPREFWRVNIEGLKSVLRAAAEVQIERVVYTSSFIALGPSADENAGEDLCHPKTFSNQYEESKTRALDWLREEGYAQFPVITLMPGVIYGPGPRTEGNLVGGMIKQYLAGKFPGLLGKGNQRWSFAFNADVAAAHLAALENGRVGEEYVLAGDNRTLNEFFQVLAQLSGVRRSVRHIPFGIAKWIAKFEMWRAQRPGYTPQLTPGVVEIFKQDWVYSSAKAESELGYHVTPLEEGLRATLDSMKH